MKTEMNIAQDCELLKKHCEKLRISSGFMDRAIRILESINDPVKYGKELEYFYERAEELSNGK